jgi:hypothetical protein
MINAFWRPYAHDQRVVGVLISASWAYRATRPASLAGAWDGSHMSRRPTISPRRAKCQVGDILRVLLRLVDADCWRDAEAVWLIRSRVLLVIYPLLFMTRPKDGSSSPQGRHRHVGVDSLLIVHAAVRSGRGLTANAWAAIRTKWIVSGTLCHAGRTCLTSGGHRTNIEVSPVAPWHVHMHGGRVQWHESYAVAVVCSGTET